MRSMRPNLRVVIGILTALIVSWGAAHSQAPSRIDPRLASALAGSGEVQYLVILQESADLGPARAIADRTGRARAVHARLRDVAERTQTSLRAFLSAESAAGRVRRYRSFISVNALGVVSSPATLRALARFPEVDRIVPAEVARVPDLVPAAAAQTQAVGWNLTRVRAPVLWDAGIRGEGLVVANIDTGVQFDHPALVSQYRGNLGGAVFDHNYNWWDASSLFGAQVPTDNHGHGTHTMGTMVGDDGGVNAIGVAPDARWISCKACAGSTCSFFGLLECGDFMLAPWDLNGLNPDPSRRPDVVNNSWSFNSGGVDVYRGVVSSWVAAGIFPAFAAGNSGSACGTALSPGDYPEAFATGATDMNDAAAGFSSRGPSFFGGTVKPDIGAPGVAVRSSVPFDAYTTASGTSMASPHTAGLVALLWSVYPGLRNDIESTERKLQPAADIVNTVEGCGGDGPTSHPNNVFGWGIQDAPTSIIIVNVFTDRSVYTSGETAQLGVSLVNPADVPLEVEVHLGSITPEGGGSFIGHVPTTLPPLAEDFDFIATPFTWTTEPNGEYTLFVIATPVGADPLDPANQLGVDVAPVTKQ